MENEEEERIWEGRGSEGERKKLWWEDWEMDSDLVDGQKACRHSKSPEPRAAAAAAGAARPGLTSKPKPSWGQLWGGGCRVLEGVHQYNALRFCQLAPKPFSGPLFHAAPKYCYTHALCCCSARRMGQGLGFLHHGYSIKKPSFNN